jgi:hypothetical protein
MVVEGDPRQDSSVEPLATQATDPRHGLIAQPAAVTHVVCCRTDPWEVSMCGYDVTHGNLNFAGDDCAMCIAAAREMWSSRKEVARDEHCPYDGSPCPSDEWLFNRVASETS